MLAHCQAEYPHEGCGLVSGKGKTAKHIYEIDNILNSRTAYEMDPLQQVQTMLAIEASAEDLIAIYHSHPEGPAHPSATDVAQAYYPEAIYLIVSLLNRAEPGISGFWLDEASIDEVPLIIE